MSRPRAAFHAQLRGKASVHDVLRALMEHGEWLVPLHFFDGSELATARKVSFSPRSQVPGQELWVFSEQGTAQQACLNGALLGSYVAGVPGMILFQRLPASLDTLRVNPSGWEEDALVFERSGFGTLAGWARTIQLERLIAGASDPETNAALVERMRGHLTYRVPILPDGRMIARPGHDGFEQPSVVCTSADSYDAFLRALEAQLAERVECRIVDGGGLAELVARQKIDAILLNPLGPGPDRVLPRSVVTRSQRAS